MFRCQCECTFADKYLIAKHGRPKTLSMLSNEHVEILTCFDGNNPTSERHHNSDLHGLANCSLPYYTHGPHVKSIRAHDYLAERGCWCAAAANRAYLQLEIVIRGIVDRMFPIALLRVERWGMDPKMPRGGQTVRIRSREGRER